LAMAAEGEVLDWGQVSVSVSAWEQVSRSVTEEEWELHPALLRVVVPVWAALVVQVRV
jgi:hypothetical protein